MYVWRTPIDFVQLVLQDGLTAEEKSTKEPEELQSLQV